MIIETFIKKAIKGGWKHEDKETLWEPNHNHCITMRGKDNADVVPIEKIVLDPLAWQAVGKVETEEFLAEEYGRVKMLQMTQALIDGKSIEEYIETL